jgi:DNA-binding SARP family transcriptional activator
MAEQRGDLPGARQQLQRALQADFYPEVLHRRLMELRASLGEWDELAAGFRRLEHRLGTEHDAQPEPETYDLFRRLVAQAPKPRRVAAECRLRAPLSPPGGSPAAGDHVLPSAEAGTGP